MRRAFLLALLVGSLTPAGAQAAACGGDTTSARAAITLAGKRVVVCDRRTGRVRVLRRQRTPDERFVAGPWVAWTEGSSPRRSAYVLDVRAPRAAPRRRSLTSGDIIVLTRFGDLAWASLDAQRAWSQRLGARRKLLPVTEVRALELEDAATIVVRFGPEDETSRERRFDLRPPPTAAGCPVRPSWRVVETSPSVLIRRTAREFRLCVRALRREVVIDAEDENRSFDRVVEGFRIGPGWVAWTTVDRLDGEVRSRVINTVRTGSLSARRFSGEPGRIPCTGTEASETACARTLVVTAAGLPVWLTGTAAGDEIATPEQVLDSAPAGALSGLALDGETLRWNRDGQPRAAPAR